MRAYHKHLTSQCLLLALSSSPATVIVTPGSTIQVSAKDGSPPRAVGSRHFLTRAEHTIEKTRNAVLATTENATALGSLIDRGGFWLGGDGFSLRRCRAYRRVRGSRSRSYGRRHGECGLIDPAGCAAFHVLNFGKAPFATDQTKWPTSWEAIHD